MAAGNVFQMDGLSYNVRVLSLKRNFALEEKGKTGRTQDGQMFRDLFGTYYHYTMKIAQQTDDRAALEAFWEAISQPKNSHICTFPYGQSTLTQRMYVTGGEQELRRMGGDGNTWGEIQVHFLGVEPEVTP